jgi:hypothetical protein
MDTRYWDIVIGVGWKEGLVFIGRFTAQILLKLFENV